jgi:transcriptional regulator with XRE-family HTH domain
MCECERAIKEALGEERDDWLERACAIIRSDVARRDTRRRVDVSSVGARLRWARQCAGVTQAELGRRLGFAPSRRQVMVSYFENGKRDIPLSKLKAWAVICQVDASWLAMQTDEGAPGPSRVILRNEPSEYTKWKNSQSEWKKKRKP